MCSQKDKMTDYYDLNDKATREKLNSAGFVLVVRDSVQ